MSHIEDSLEEVLNVAADGSETGHLFPGGKPNFNSDPLLPQLSQFHVHVFERLGERSTRPLNSHRAALARHSHYMGRQKLQLTQLRRHGVHTHGTQALTLVRNCDDTRPQYGLHDCNVLQRIRKDVFILHCKISSEHYTLSV